MIFNAQKLFVLVGMIFVVISCERSGEWSIDGRQDVNLVVHGMLTNEFSQQEIFLSRTFVNLYESAPPIIDADVRVIANNQLYLFVADMNHPGRYVSEEAFEVVEQLDYQLEIDWQGQMYSATSRLSNVLPIPEISFNPVGQDSFRIGDNIVPLFSANQQAMYEIDIDWSQIEPVGINRARAIYYTFNSVHISEFVRPPREDIIFPAGAQAIVSKYGLRDDFADFLRSTAIETDWNGNYFYGNPQNSPTNIVPGAYGFFATVAVLRDSIIVE